MHHRPWVWAACAEGLEPAVGTERRAVVPSEDLSSEHRAVHREEGLKAVRAWEHREQHAVGLRAEDRVSAGDVWSVTSH